MYDYCIIHPGFLQYGTSVPVVDKTRKAFHAFPGLAVQFLGHLNRVKGAKHRQRRPWPLTRRRVKIIFQAPAGHGCPAGVIYPVFRPQAVTRPNDARRANEAGGSAGRCPEPRRGAERGCPPKERAPHGINRTAR